MSTVIPPGSFERCWCTGVSREQVQRAFTCGAHTVEEIIRTTQACTGCRTCRPELQQFLNELAADARVQAQAQATMPPSPPVVPPSAS